MIKSDLGDQFAIIIVDVQAFIDVLMLNCKQLLVNQGECLNLPTINFGPNSRGKIGFNFKNDTYEYNRE